MLTGSFLAFWCQILHKAYFAKLCDVELKPFKIMCSDAFLLKHINHGHSRLDTPALSESNQKTKPLHLIVKSVLKKKKKQLKNKQKR